MLTKSVAQGTDPVCISMSPARGIPRQDGKPGEPGVGNSPGQECINSERGQARVVLEPQRGQRGGR
jgi:hypothetical protein